jgi:hypothetical protein
VPGLPAGRSPDGVIGELRLDSRLAKRTTETTAGAPAEV